MKLAEFDDFLASLDPDRFSRLRHKAAYGTADLVEIPPQDDPAYTDAMIALMHAEASTVITGVQVYLRMYHEWLSAQLEGMDQSHG